LWQLLAYSFKTTFTVVTSHECFFAVCNHLDISNSAKLNLRNEGTGRQVMMESKKSIEFGKIWLKWYAVNNLDLNILCGLTPSLICTENPKFFSFFQQKYIILSSSTHSYNKTNWMH